MANTVELKGRPVGRGHPTYVIAEIGINHNGDLEIAKKLIDAAAHSGCDAVKFQKRTPELCVPVEMRDKMRETPWGYITYMDYRRRIELGLEQYRAIDAHCRQRKIAWFASPWDVSSVEFMEQFDPPCHKIASACLTHKKLLEAVRATGRPVMLSTGMSTMEQIRAAVKVLGTERLLVAHSTSTYPCPLEELNLRMVQTLARNFECPIGYSGHETGLSTTVGAVALGASFVERHVTLDRAMWGSDHAASVEPVGLARMVKDIRNVERSLGTGEKVVYEGEKKAAQRLRMVDDLVG